MDLIYADENKIDVGVLNNYKFDLAFGSEENDFEITVELSNNVCKEDYFVYMEGTEYGGIVDSISVDTASKKVVYKGRTFHGLLDKKIISPNAGEDYYIVSGDANEILAGLIERLALDEFFTASDEESVTISNYKFARYISGYTGICKMLASVGYKLKIEYKGGYAELSAIPVKNYSDAEELDNDRVELNIKKTFNPVNHLICLGSGDLKDREVVHLYLDESGNVSETQTFFGVDEIAEVYDYANVESLEELKKSGAEKLKDQEGDSIELTLKQSYEFDIGDVITAHDIVSGLSVTQKVQKKIVTINNAILNINYKVGE